MTDNGNPLDADIIARMIHLTTARSGGSGYSLTMSRTLSTNVRNGTADLFAAPESHHRASAHPPAPPPPRHGVPQVPGPPRPAGPPEFDVHLMLDNYSTHKAPQFDRWLLRRPASTCTSTHTEASWINLVERWFVGLTTKKLRRSSHTSVKELVADMTAWIRPLDGEPSLHMVKTDEEIL